MTTPRKTASRKPARASHDSSPAGRPWLQWAMAALGAVMTAGVIAIVIHEAVQPPAPPVLSARLIAARPTPAGWIAEIQVDNAGDDTAAAVEVEGVLGDQTAHAALDYVPGQGHARASLRFDGDPRAARLRVAGWSEP